MPNWIEETGYPITPVMSVANNGVSYLFDSTANANSPPGATSPGSRRSGFLGGWLVIQYFYITAQNVTASVKRLVEGPSGTFAWFAEVAANCPQDDAGSSIQDGATITASATPSQSYRWFMDTEKRLYLTNGATGPTIADVKLFWYPGGY